MGHAEKRTFSLPAEHMTFIDEQVASGSYASASEVVRAGLRALQERDAAVAPGTMTTPPDSVAETASAEASWPVFNKLPPSLITLITLENRPAIAARRRLYRSIPDTLRFLPNR